MNTIMNMNFVLTADTYHNICWIEISLIYFDNYAYVIFLLFFLKNMLSLRRDSISQILEK